MNRRHFLLGGAAALGAALLPISATAACAAAGPTFSPCRGWIFNHTGDAIEVVDIAIELKRACIWENLDGLYVFAAHDERSAALNWTDATVLQGAKEALGIAERERGERA